MDNAAAIMESTRICFQNDIKINPDGTKNIKALMVTQKDKIDELEQDVTKNENSFTNTTNLIKNLNESVNKIFADLKAKEENLNTDLLKWKGSIRDLIYLLNRSVELNKKLMWSAQDSFDEEMHSYQEKLSKIENLIKCNQEIGSKLSERIETKQIQNKQLDSDITTLKDIVKDVVDKDVCRQIELKQYHLQELKTMFQKMQDAEGIRRTTK